MIILRKSTVGKSIILDLWFYGPVCASYSRLFFFIKILHRSAVVVGICLPFTTHETIWVFIPNDLTAYTHGLFEIRSAKLECARRVRAHIILYYLSHTFVLFILFFLGFVRPKICRQMSKGAQQICFFLFFA